jgi:hypothetical protein
MGREPPLSLREPFADTALDNLEEECADLDHFADPDSEHPFVPSPRFVRGHCTISSQCSVWKISESTTTIRSALSEIPIGPINRAQRSRAHPSRRRNATKHASRRQAGRTCIILTLSIHLGTVRRCPAAPSVRRDREDLHAFGHADEIMRCV